MNGSTGGDAGVVTRRTSKRSVSAADLEPINGATGPKKRDNPTTSASLQLQPQALQHDAYDYASSVTNNVASAPLPRQTPTIRELDAAEIEELELVLEFRSPDLLDHWKDDWSGNLVFVEKDILNPSVKSTTNNNKKQRKAFRQPLYQWARHSDSHLRLLKNLFCHCCRSPKVPATVKKIVAAIESETNGDTILHWYHRASYDRQVLAEDGWTTTKAAPIGATGGPALIGDALLMDNSDAVVIAYIHDADIGDLWKCLWTEDYIAFDLEAEELLDAKRKWDKRQSAQQQQQAQEQTQTTDALPKSASIGMKPRGDRASRAVVSSEFTVKGIEHGIVLASSYARGARQTVYWPARVMHASESGWGGAGGGGGATNGSSGSATVRRNISKQKIDLVFLAPYWSPDEVIGRTAPSLSENGESIFNSHPLFHVETVDALDERLQEYTFANNERIDLTQLQMSFRFTGLPKSAFSRYMDAHRLALALRTYAETHLKGSYTATDRATAGLFETHPMSVQAPLFPPVILHLPYGFILSQLPRSIGERNSFEPVLNLEKMVKRMKPPYCWGDDDTAADSIGTPNSRQRTTDESSPGVPWWRNADGDKENGKDYSHDIEEFMKDYPLLNDSLNRYYDSPPLVGVQACVAQLLTQIATEHEAGATGADLSARRNKLVASWAVAKRLGDESLATLLRRTAGPVLAQWREIAEKIYKYILRVFSDSKTSGPGFSLVITDPRCNSHRTTGGSFERPVRLPAALKGAKIAGVGTDERVHLLTSVPNSYIELVESKLLVKAHCSTYLKRMKTRCAAARVDDDVLVLTDNTDGEGGEDTRKLKMMPMLTFWAFIILILHRLHHPVGSRGTWLAAVTGVAAAVAATEMVVRGEYVNAFCVTRPPGHHAGRSIHAMKAISNGFCILNTVACTALHAVSPVCDGGLGLSRVCVIDFDVHHGNGTQDILCSTFDPRFLYVSLHAGGAEVNGRPLDDDPNHELHDLGNRNKQTGIYPGRCGDSSPHEGVLNIPLGARVTSHGVGTALLNKVTPRVEAFSPDLIILSAGFDAHKNDPMGLGGLQAEDFGHITQVACQIAFKCCSGRVVSVLEGGYGVPCCRPQVDLFLPKPRSTGSSDKASTVSEHISLRGDNGQSLTSVQADATVLTDEGLSATTDGNLSTTTLLSDSKVDAVAIVPSRKRPIASKLLDLGDDLPDDMDDQVPVALQIRLEKCHVEGFVECVCHHVKSLIQCNTTG